jgi:hypothetical protein
MILTCYKTNTGAGNTLVSSKLTENIVNQVILLILRSWRLGPYRDPEQQGDKLGHKHHPRNKDLLLNRQN